MITKRTKAIVLLSGGLDSMLAVRILQAQNIEVEALCFVSNFYDAQKAKEAALVLDIKLHEIDIKKAMLDLVKNPPNGYGKNMNPCIDCHGMMFSSVAGAMADKQVEYDFLATGEVLGQRPFSQNKQALSRVQKLAGYDILRPLSAKLLPETEMETSGLVDRNQLFDIQGRTRDRQMELAEKFNIKKYPSSGGGCLLTDSSFSERLGRMFQYWSDCETDDVELLKSGRVFWLSFRRDNENAAMVLLMIGRHKEDNARLEKLVKKGDFVVKLKDEMGPTALIRIKAQKIINKLENEVFAVNVPIDISEMSMNKEFSEITEVSGKLTGFYATKMRGKKALFDIKKI